MMLNYILEICSEGRFYAVFLLRMVTINKTGINFGFGGQIYVIRCDTSRYTPVSKLIHLDALKMCTTVCLLIITQ